MGGPARPRLQGGGDAGAAACISPARLSVALCLQSAGQSGEQELESLVLKLSVLKDFLSSIERKVGTRTGSIEPPCPGLRPKRASLGRGQAGLWTLALLGGRSCPGRAPRAAAAMHPVPLCNLLCLAEARKGWH